MCAHVCMCVYVCFRGIRTLCVCLYVPLPALHTHTCLRTHVCVCARVCVGIREASHEVLTDLMRQRLPVAPVVSCTGMPPHTLRGMLLNEFALLFSTLPDIPFLPHLQPWLSLLRSRDLASVDVSELDWFIGKATALRSLGCEQPLTATALSALLFTHPRLRGSDSAADSGDAVNNDAGFAGAAVAHISPFVGAHGVVSGNLRSASLTHVLHEV